MSGTAHILTDIADIAKELKGITHFELILVYEGVRGQRKEPTKHSARISHGRSARRGERAGR